MPPSLWWCKLYAPNKVEGWEVKRKRSFFIYEKHVAWELRLLGRTFCRLAIEVDVPLQKFLPQVANYMLYNMLLRKKIARAPG